MVSAWPGACAGKPEIQMSFLPPAVLLIGRESVVPICSREEEGEGEKRGGGGEGD